MITRSLTMMVICMLAVASVHGQEAHEVFERSSRITWLGLDFTSAKFVGDRERFGSTSDVQHLMQSWNELMEKERDKFNVSKALNKDRIRVEEGFDVTKEHNANLDPSEMFSNDEKDFTHLSASDISAIIADYDFKDKSGVGMMMNVECFSKPKQQSAVWVTFINLNNKEVLFTERMIGEPGGANLRNYWANSIFEILNKMRKELEGWKKKYDRKY